MVGPSRSSADQFASSSIYVIIIFRADDPIRGAFVKGITEVAILCAEDATDLLVRGLKSRTVGATAMNEQSSRSHSIFRVVVESRLVAPEDAGTSEVALSSPDAVPEFRESDTGAGATPSKCTPGKIMSAWADTVPVKVGRLRGTTYLHRRRID